MRNRFYGFPQQKPKKSCFCAKHNISKGVLKPSESTWVSFLVPTSSKPKVNSWAYVAVSASDGSNETHFLRMLGNVVFKQGIRSAPSKLYYYVEGPAQKTYIDFRVKSNSISNIDSQRLLRILKINGARVKSVTNLDVLTDGSFSFTVEVIILKGSRRIVVDLPGLLDKKAEIPIEPW